MTVRDLFTQAGVTLDRLEGDAEVVGMVMDSRRAKLGSMFVAMPSKNSDANAHIPAAHVGGSTSVLTFSSEGFETARKLGMSAALLAEDRYQDSLWRLAKIAFGNPSASMKIIGVTGTNGKTTVAWLIRDMLTALGVRAGYLGTLGFQIPGEERELQNTTPFAIELNELLAESRDKGVEAIAMEVSSHALAEKRVDGVEFDVGVFTNLTQDHLDFHGTMEEYEAAKLRLFTELPLQSNKEFQAAVNIDDPAGFRLSAKMREALGRPKAERLPFQFGMEGPQLKAEVETIAVDHITLKLRDWDRRRPPFSSSIRVPVGGTYNVENTLAASSSIRCLGYSMDSLEYALPRVRPVPGRFEPVPNDAGISILVDYAHTPDAIEKLLDTVRDILDGSKIQNPKSKILTVFGCGGDRDKAKRPLMAKAASERSDVTVITSDNPRTEDPLQIIQAVAAGIDDDVDWSRVAAGIPIPNPFPLPAQTSGKEKGRAIVILDRGEAISYAIKVAQPGDVVVIAGKGHENYQIIGRTKVPMDDRELARKGLAARS